MGSEEGEERVQGPCTGHWLQQEGTEKMVPRGDDGSREVYILVSFLVS